VITGDASDSMQLTKAQSNDTMIIGGAVEGSEPPDSLTRQQFWSYCQFNMTYGILLA